MSLGWYTWYNMVSLGQGHWAGKALAIQFGDSKIVDTKIEDLYKVSLPKHQPMRTESISLVDGDEGWACSSRNGHKWPLATCTQSSVRDRSSLRLFDPAVEKVRRT